jgi:hypothetical protein
MVRLRLGEFLVQKNMVRDADVENALAVQSSVGGLLGLILVRLGALSESDWGCQSKAGKPCLHQHKFRP